MATTGSTAATSSQLDVVIDGTWVIVPSVDAKNNINGVEVYSPSCGHPHGAFFTNQLNPNPWPDAKAFYMLDNHSHYLAIQRSSGSTSGMPLSGINQNLNHCLPQKRPFGTSWDLMLSIAAGPDSWTSADTVSSQTTDPSGKPVPCFSGKDAPTGKVSSLQTLSYRGVTAVDFCGAPIALQSLLPVPWSGVGSLIFEGEVPYIPSIQHERAAYSAMAGLAGLDLSLDYPLPPLPVPPQASGSVARPMINTTKDCGYALIVLP
jgi:hypothetical protein